MSTTGLYGLSKNSIIYRAYQSAIAKDPSLEPMFSLFCRFVAMRYGPLPDDDNHATRDMLEAAIHADKAKWATIMRYLPTGIVELLKCNDITP
jgi:hypothetical protein